LAQSLHYSLLFRKGKTRIVKALIVGTVRDVAPSIARDVNTFLRKFSSLLKLDFFLVESDSIDATESVLANLKIAHANFDYVSLGKIQDHFPQRIERLRFARNVYVDYIRENQGEFNWDFVIVIDFDEVNKRISARGVSNSLKKMKDWDAVFANQFPFYYDIFALRSDGWVESDCYREIESAKMASPFHRLRKKKSLVYFLDLFIHFDRIRVKCLYSKMKSIHPWRNLLPVQSAFGGFGIYKAEVFLSANYDSRRIEPGVYCEHVDLHISSLQKGKSLYINPAMINSFFNEYSFNKFQIIRFLKEYRKFFREPDLTTPLI
jgi:hypothetical protein